jgi:hypothetical protein
LSTSDVAARFSRSAQWIYKHGAAKFQIDGTPVPEPTSLALFASTAWPSPATPGFAARETRDDPLLMGGLEHDVADAHEHEI